MIKRIQAILENLDFLHILYGGYSVLDATVLLYFIQDTFGLYGTGIEGWRPDIS